MSTMTYTTTTRRIVRAEWTKLRTLPATWRTAVLTMVASIVVRAITVSTTGSSQKAKELQRRRDGARTVLRRSAARQ